MKTKMLLKVIIIDDNEIDRLTALAFVKKYPFLQIAGVFDSATEALKNIQNLGVDVLLTDIDMPDLNGLDFRAILKNIPVCIFISAYPNYAIESFEVDAFDFLVKPIKAERFDLCMNRLQSYFSIKQKAELFEHSLGGDIIFIKDGHQQIKLNLHEILYLEALKDYTRIITETKKYSVLSSIGNLLLETPFQSFIRIHRSYAVQPNFITKISTTQVYIKDLVLPIGRSYKEVLINLK
jgi:two-component system LytT family response regulator